MKCNWCGTEFDEKIYPVCYFCHREKSASKRFWKGFWDFVFVVLSIAMFALCLVGIESLAGWPAAVVLCVSGLFLFIAACIKRRQREKNILEAEIKKILGEEVDGILLFEIIKSIRGSQ